MGRQVDERTASGGAWLFCFIFFVLLLFCLFVRG
jgi:hypothetical protein